MHRFQFILGVILGLCLVGQWSWAETAYVTDSLKITLRTGPSVENKIIAMLSSAQAVEVLDSFGDWSQVRLITDGESTKEGWVLSRFLMSRLPWQIQAHSLIEENTRLKQRLSPIEKKLSEADRREQELVGKLQETTGALSKLKKEYDSLKEGAKGYLKLKASYGAASSQLETIKKAYQNLREENKGLRSSQRNKWFATGALVLLCGLVIGLVLGRQQKKRRSSLYY